MKSAVVIFLSAWLCSCSAIQHTESTDRGVQTARPDIIATNAFYYYDDVDAAWRFYSDTMGFETVVDYGFAKIVRIAESSYLTLVQASEGMHSADEPKTVTLSLVTDELSRWADYLETNAVPMRIEYRTPVDQATNDPANNSFVAVDPEGYYLKFLRYNPHPNHASFVAPFANTVPVPTRINTAEGPLSIRATAFSAYFEDIDHVRPFYEELFRRTPVGQIDGIDAYQFSRSGFLLLVDGSDELHSPTQQSGVTYSFLTTDVDSWFVRATRWPGFELRTPEILDEGGGLVRVFVGYDPAGTFLEWDTFQDSPENESLLRYLR